jgi:hypothetical protein
MPEMKLLHPNSDNQDYYLFGCDNRRLPERSGPELIARKIARTELLVGAPHQKITMSLLTETLNAIINRNRMRDELFGIFWRGANESGAPGPDRLRPILAT